MKSQVNAAAKFFCGLLVMVFVCTNAYSEVPLNFADIRKSIQSMDTGSMADLTAYTLTLDEMQMLQTAFPHMDFKWEISIYGQTISQNDTAFDAGDYVITDYDELELLLHVFPHLKTFDMYATKIEKAEINRLSQAFPDIVFGWSMKVGVHTIRTDATAFSTLYRGSGPLYTSEDFEVIKCCRNLYALDLGHNPLGDVNFISGLTDLKVLILAKCKITDIAPLAGLTKLEYLELFSNQIKDISPLVNMSNLAYLELSVNDIRDYTPLLNMPWLQRVNVTRSSTSIPKAALKESLPNTRIDMLVNPTKGDWRKSKRYLWAAHIFHSGIYTPWEEK